MIHHRRCGGCGRDVADYTTLHEDFDVLCRRCRMDLDDSEQSDDLDLDR